MTRCVHVAVLLAAVGMSTSGCSKDEPLTVRIFPKRYEVAGVASELATPAVDEVVRRKPRRVHIYTCMNTPPGRHLQFVVELDARHKAEVAGGFIDERECR